MFVSKEQTALNRDALLQAASRLLREKGIDGVGVAEIAKEAGLTHGALYKHFPSKDVLAAEAFPTDPVEVLEVALLCPLLPHAAPTTAVISAADATRTAARLTVIDSSPRFSHACQAKLRLPVSPYSTVGRPSTRPAPHHWPGTRFRK